MAKLRKLWKVTQGFRDGVTEDPSTKQHVESQSKVYGIYVPNNVRTARADAHLSRQAYDHTDVWVDERDGHGWRWHERIQHDEHPLWRA